MTFKVKNLSTDIMIDLETMSPEEIVVWSREHFGTRVFVSSSFQTHSIPLLHMISVHAPDLEVVFLDTGFHFPETIRFRDQVAHKFGLRLRNLRCDIGHAAFLRQYGSLYGRDPDRCCFINKTDPIDRLMDNYDAWITGVRRDQSPTRNSTPILHRRENGKFKIAPLALMTSSMIEEYCEAHNLPSHPLTEQGYTSIGCYPCTRRNFDPENDRAGRWAGTSKVECGLHEDYFTKAQSKGEPDDEKQ